MFLVADLASLTHTVYPDTSSAGSGFTNVGIITYGLRIHKVRTPAIQAFSSFLFSNLLFRFGVKKAFL